METSKQQFKLKTKRITLLHFCPEHPQCIRMLFGNSSINNILISKIISITYKVYLNYIFSSVQFSCSVMSDSLWPHEPQHTRSAYPSPTARVYTNPCPLSLWCHPTISSSVVPFSSCSQSFPASWSFPMSQFLTPGGQSIRDSASVLMNIQDWFPLGLTGWISLSSKGLPRVFSNTTVQKYLFFST